MKTWLLHVGEELPGDPSPRLFRYGRLTEELVDRGHQVLRWAPTFQHFRKQQRYDSDRQLAVKEGYDLQFVHAPGYQSNVSLRRLRMYQRLARRFDSLATAHDKPDLIIAGLPSLEWCASAIKYGRKHDVPVVLDVRDLWPDIYASLLPVRLRPAALWALKPLRRKVGRLFAEAAGLCGVSQSYLDWGLKLAGRQQQTSDRVFPLGYTREDLPQSKRAALLAEMEAAGVSRERTICCFSGLLEKSYDITSIVKAAQQLEARYPEQYQIVVAGSGQKEEMLRQAAATNPALVALGWVQPEKISAMMSIASVGLAAYSPGALQSLPNKTFEYLSAGLAIVSSLQGEFSHLLSKHKLGEQYLAGDGAGMASAIVRLTADNDRLKATQDRALALYEERFTSQRIYAEFADYLETFVTSSDIRTMAA